MHEQSPLSPQGNNIQPGQTTNKRTIEEALAYNYDFEIVDVMTKAWAKVDGIKLPCFLVLLSVVIANIVLGFILQYIPSIIGFAVQILVSAVITAMSATMMLIALRHLRGEKVDIKECASFVANHAVLLITAALLASILTFVGFILLIIPGIYLAVSYTFVQWIIIDNPGVTAWQALEISRKIVLKHFFKVLLLGIALGFIAAVSAIPLGIGLFWTMPLFVLSIGTVYQTIFEK